MGWWVEVDGMAGKIYSTKWRQDTSKAQKPAWNG